MKMFPEFQEGGIYSPEDTRYFYFAPSWHVRSGLITESDVNGFLVDNSKRLLSVGSGSAYLERFLSELGINKENITLSDINLEVLPHGFKTKNFNMEEEWPDLENEKYDLIIFPESVDFNSIKFSTDTQNQDLLHHLITQSLDHLKPNGILRIDGHCQDENRIHAVKQKLEKEGRKVKITYNDQLIEVKNETIA